MRLAVGIPTTPFSTGLTITTDQANFDGAQTYGGSAKGQYRQRTLEIGAFKPNAFGLHDLHGNVSEWVEDCYQDSYVGAPTDGSARAIANCAYRIFRGGSWHASARDIRSASRMSNFPDYRDDQTGFRVARSL
jgi:formylglycine-generating enzyme required for sulfatase activity